MKPILVDLFVSLTGIINVVNSQFNLTYDENWSNSSLEENYSSYLNSKLEGINNTLSISTTSLIVGIVDKYYIQRSCFTIVSENRSDIFVTLDRYQNNTITLIHIDDKNENEIFGLLLKNYEISCDWYIVQTSDPPKFISMVKEVMEIALHRTNPRMLFVPYEYETKEDMAQIIFNETRDYMPDVLVMELVNTISGTLMEFRTGDWLTGKSITLHSCFLEECNIVNIDFFPDKLVQARGKILRYATFHYPPYSFLMPQAAGTEYKVIESFANRYNYTLSLCTDDSMWGEIFENKTGNGILGNVYMRKADVGFGALYLWFYESQFLDYSFPYIRTGITCLVPRVQEVPPWRLPLLPFDIVLWLMVFLTMTVSTVTLYYVAKVANQFSSNWRLRFRTMSDCVIRVIGLTVLQVPTAKGIKPPPLPLRYVITFLEIMFLLICTSYHSGLASNLTVHQYGKPIETVQDLVDSNLPWGARHDAWIFSIRLTQEKNSKILLERFKTPSFESLKSHGKTRDFAYSVERLPGGFFAVGDYITADAIPFLQLMKEDIYYEHVVMVIPKGSPYLDKLNKMIDRIRSAGLPLFWEREMGRNYLPTKVQYGVARSNMIVDDTQNAPRNLEVQNILGSLIILAIGHTIAAITLICERFYVWKETHHPNIIKPLKYK